MAAEETEESNERSHANNFQRRCGSSVAVSLCDVHERAIIYKIIVRFVPDERDKHDVIRAFGRKFLITLVSVQTE